MKSLLLPLLLLGCFSAYSQQNLQAPVTKKLPKTFNEHGHTRTDDYYWLNNRKDTAVIPHLMAENAYTEAYMKHTEGLQKKIYDELVSRVDQNYHSLPVKENGYWYYLRYQEGAQYPLLCRKKSVLTAQEEVYLDESQLAKGHKIYMVRGSKISPDNSWIAFGADTSGDRRCTIHFKNLANGTTSNESISNAATNYAWGNDNKTFFYTLNDPTVRSYKVMRHIMGTDPNQDKEIYAENDSTYSVELSPSLNNKYIFIVSASKTTTEARYIPADQPLSAPVLIQKRIKDVQYRPEYYQDNAFYIYTNYKAKNFKYVNAPITNPGIYNWKDIVPHQPDALLENVVALNNYFVLQYRQKALTQIKVVNRINHSSYFVKFNEDAYLASLNLATDDYNIDSVRYSYTSLTTPVAQYSYNLVSQQPKLLKQQKVGGGFVAANYETRRLWVKVTDGTLVPVSIVYRKNLFKKDGSNPMLLYAYGSYGINSDPAFNSDVISLLDRGFVYGIAHIRGGQEMGRYWFEDQGRVFHKKNTFTDYVDCAQYLVNEKYTSPNRLFANGVSAGGMLMGAITNMRPDLFRGVLAEVPWMDVITDMFDTSLPLTTLEYEDWGDPNNKAMYEYMLSWSPYDNVKKAKYPAIFATGGYNDTQVPYFSPAKWVAKVRENNLGTEPVLFRANMGAGHSGDSGRFERLKLTAIKYAFMLDLLGRTE